MVPTSKSGSGVRSDDTFLKQCSDFLSIQLIGRVEMPALPIWMASILRRRQKAACEMALSPIPKPHSDTFQTQIRSDSLWLA